MGKCGDCGSSCQAVIFWVVQNRSRPLPLHCTSQSFVAHVAKDIQCSATSVSGSSQTGSIFSHDVLRLYLSKMCALISVWSISPVCLCDRDDLMKASMSTRIVFIPFPCISSPITLILSAIAPFLDQISTGIGYRAVLTMWLNYCTTITTGEYCFETQYARII
ncbi:uncharacterized protein BO96DRAFT_196128 [Aspergillus niger CBS 101883]|uniref:uncharacterized protein n=1 Tax=Aspergillus lacticoffeatus (strain CBS 101883) TaxID=1450533 RepID=UPI000D7F16DB|nr:uncharacterized protein BO96DRAFT_196128 [Aspergillus niger CBS 101883]PYH51229.1 hypothetical protein BO96DRAFT_196128 [Aspergillus niger CBS 101883]